MNKNSPGETCAHKSCVCPVGAGQTYCGPHCANAAAQAQPERVETNCACGHAQCTQHDRALLPQ